jgi:hypothetical protein
MDVPIRCVCPPKADGSPRHEGDTVTLRDTLGFVATQTARNAVELAKGEARAAGEDHVDAALALALLTEQYLLLGIESWTLVDAKGKPLPVHRTTIRELIEGDDNDDVASLISDEADGLYSKKVMLPLLAKASTSSPPTPTDSTSPTRGNGQGKASGKPSKRSSISTIPTADTAGISKSPDGDSSSSRSSASAA